ncbi:hypothetical protein Tco_1122878 [Tanacetum coccineum]|uniref:Uncharacterized protein n=1 Tax=Tanacetum coccineum TaxID=301880 RepID=A0ABQ5J4B4_9ASTR
MTKVIKGEFEKIKDVKVKDVSLTCDTPLEVFNNEVNRLSGMDDDLFTYEFDVANILCDSKMDDDSEHEADDDMGSLDPFLEDYIELNDLNEPFKLRRNQGDDLMPTIEEGKVVEEFRIWNEDLDIGIDNYPSYCDDDKKIHIDSAHNLKKFYNSIMKNKMVYKGNNVVETLINVPIFVGTFSVMTNFEVLENMDAYRDEGMGDVIFGEPFLREADIKSKQFEGMIILYKGDDEVTYQMVRSHSRFKHHTNEQCNKIPPLLKVNEKDVMHGVLHAYQNL